MTPTKKQREFIDRDARLKIIVGGIASGKTTAVLMDIDRVLEANPDATIGIVGMSRLQVNRVEDLIKQKHPSANVSVHNVDSDTLRGRKFDYQWFHSLPLGMDLGTSRWTKGAWLEYEVPAGATIMETGVPMKCYRCHAELAPVFGSNPLVYQHTAKSLEELPCPLGRYEKVFS